MYHFSDLFFACRCMLAIRVPGVRTNKVETLIQFCIYCKHLRGCLSILRLYKFRCGLLSIEHAYKIERTIVVFRMQISCAKSIFWYPKLEWIRVLKSLLSRL